MPCPVRNESLFVYLVASVLIHALAVWELNVATGPHFADKVFGLTRSPGATPSLTAFLDLERRTEAVDLIPRSEVRIAKKETQPSIRRASDTKEMRAGKEIQREGGLTHSSDTRYVDASELTKRPRLIRDVFLDNLPAPDNAGVGRIILQLAIDEDGEVTKVLKEDSPLPDDELQFVMAPLRTLLFEPGEIDGKPVKTLLRIEVSYEGKL